jgi:hypothetical protein
MWNEWWGEKNRRRKGRGKVLEFETNESAALSTSRTIGRPTATVVQVCHASASWQPKVFAACKLDSILSSPRTGCSYRETQVRKPCCPFSNIPKRFLMGLLGNPASIPQPGTYCGQAKALEH